MKRRLSLGEIVSGLPIGPVEASQNVIEQSDSMVSRDHLIEFFRK
jgi:hypothetical protein